MKRFFHQQKGFVILLAILISASILMIGAGIFSSAFKETVLASTTAESQVALFVADTGMECALYAEFILDGTPPTECAGEPVIDASTSSVQSTANPLLFSYRFRYVLPGFPSCGDVTVERNLAADGNSPGNGTNIIARGYNFCIGGALPDTSNPTLVERRLEVWYPNTDTTVAPDVSDIDLGDAQDISGNTGGSSGSNPSFDANSGTSRN